MSQKPKLKIRLMNKFFAFCKKLNFPKRHFNQMDFSRILIVSNTGVGDTMWGTPALQMLRKKYPESHITVLASPLSYAVLKNNPHIDEIIVIKRGGGLSYFLKFISFYRKKFDTIILFHCSYKWTTPFAYFLGPRRLIGFKHDAKDFVFLLTEVLEAQLNHPIIQRLMLVKRIGVLEDLYEMKIYLEPSEYQEAHNFLAASKIDRTKPLIGLQPGASEVFKCWPVEYFAELAHQLYATGATLVVFGNAKEIELAQEIGKRAPIIMAAGQLSLRASAALLSQMDAFVTNDTGPLHLALSFKLPLVTIFGPTPAHLCWPHLNNPRVRILSRPSPCEVCVYRKCRKPYCMELIEVKEVFDHIEDLLKFPKEAFSEKKEAAFSH